MLTGLMKSRLLVIVFSILVFACSSPSSTDRKVEEKPRKVVQVPDFNADSAYQFIEDQLAFGPRIPNTPEHLEAGDFLVRKFEKYGATVTQQEFEEYAYDGRLFQLRNIIASFNP